MSKNITIISIRTAPIHSSNNDESGAPKGCRVGGVYRNLQSGQSCMRNLRTHAHLEFPKFFGGIRSKDHTEMLKELLKENGCKAADVQRLADTINTVLIAKKLKDDTKQTNTDDSTDDGEKESGSTLAFVSRGQLEDVVKYVKTELKWNLDISTKAARDSANKCIGKVIGSSTPKDMVDIALFGSMFATMKSADMEGALYTSFAYSTHRTENEIDFFTAIDDNTPNVTTNNHLGTREFTSAVLVSTIVLNVDLLRHNLAGAKFTSAEFDEIVTGIINLVIRYNFAEGRHSKMLTNTIPEYVEIGCGEGQYCAASFETPVEKAPNGGYLAASIAKAKSEMKRILSMYFGKTFSVVAVDHSGINADAINKVVEYARRK